MKPIIAIIGRPNVGKSTLFNRIVGRRQALVDDTPGVTRDRQYAPADWCGREFIVVDTGGVREIPASAPYYGASAGMTSLEAGVRKQTMAAMEEADAVVCVFDGREGPTHLDKYIVEMLRKSGKPVVYAVNKADMGVATFRLRESRTLKGATPTDADTIVNQFYELGLSSGARLFPVSAEHGIGVDDLLDEVVLQFSPPPTPSPIKGEGKGEGGALRIAVIGRPNVGKSTLINRLAGAERVIAHELPGTTRDSIDVEISFGGKDYIFVDTAGLKRKGKTKTALDKFSAIKTLRAVERADVVLIMIDAGDGLTHQDRSLVDYVQTEGKGALVLLNKCDVHRVPKGFSLLHRIPFLCISAKTGEGTADIFKAVDEVSKASASRIPTSVLNKFIKEAEAGHHMPEYRGRQVRLYYSTQVGVSPPAFLIFTNYPEGIPESYKRYLINRLQEVIGEGVPVRIKFRKK